MPDVASRAAFAIACALLAVAAACDVEGRHSNAPTSCTATSGLPCGSKCCGTLCADLARDPLNCGDCGVTCSAGSVCLAGSCGCPPLGNKCGAGQTCCGTTGCVSLDSDIKNCGGCSVRCPAGAQCVHGACAGATPASTPPPGFCACSDGCAQDPQHLCVAPNCCHALFLTGECSPSTSCGLWIYHP